MLVVVPQGYLRNKQNRRREVEKHLIDMGFSVLAISDMNRNIEGTRIDMKVIQVELAKTVENKYIYIYKLAQAHQG